MNEDKEGKIVNEEAFDLSDEACDLLVSFAMERLASKSGLAVEDLNPNIMTHHSLRRTLIRAAYELGKVVQGGKTPN